jgi:hypothetical protein
MVRPNEPNTDRRRAARRIPEADEPLARVRLRAGSQLTVVDVSDAGLLVEGTARLLPGTHVDVHIVTCDGRVLARSRVVRAYVVHVEAELIRYRGALAFDRPVLTATAGYAVPSILIGAAPPQGSSYPEHQRHHPLPAHALAEATISDAAMPGIRIGDAPADPRLL